MPNTREKLIEFLKSGARELKEQPGCRTWGDLADHLVANGVTVQEWISVKDRLPEKYGKYLALTPGWLKGDSQYVRLFYYETERGFYDYDSELGEVPMDHVTHWMPLPEPPKGE